MSTEWASANRLPAKGPDFKWVLAAQAGYGLAFEELVTRNENRIYRLALNITRDQKDAETVLQNTFMKAYEHLQEFRGDSRFSKWLLRIGANEALEKVCERHPDEVALDQSAETEGNLAPKGLADWDDNPKERYTQNELKQILSEGINVLQPICRIVFLLRDVEKCSPEEVADFLGLPVPAVRSRLLRARLEMRKHLNRYFKRENHAVPSYATSAEGKQKELDNGRTISSARA
jgi:RNA polymerase sigma-70 factor (ECF subfamily)